MAAPISSSVVACLRKFHEFTEEIQNSGLEKPEGLYVQDWQDELGRLRLWAANIGAHQTNQSSLDFRLRDSSHIRQEIVELLSKIVERLQEAREAIVGDDEEEVESLEESPSEDGDSQTEIQQLQKSVATTINCLFQMSTLVRQPAPYDLCVGSKDIDVAAFEPLDYHHVTEKYPRADRILVSRLAQAITRRRMFLKYRERHAMKVKLEIDRAINVSEGDDPEALSETAATEANSCRFNIDDKASDSGFSGTSYASTLLGGGDVTILTPPRASQGGVPFECPYCYYTIAVQNTRSWNRHVFKDLQPYICTEVICNTPNKLYATERDWLHHLQVAHGHDKSSPIVEGRDETLTCGLCGESQNTRERHDRHMAGHLQKLALFVLPRSDEELDEEDEKSRTSTSNPDLLFLKHGGTRYILRFPTSSIAHRILSVAEVRREAARILLCKDHQQIKLMHMGRVLKHDRRLCRDEGLMHNSMLTVISDDPSEPSFSVMERNIYKERGYKDAQKFAVSGYACSLCSATFPADRKLWQHAKGYHSEELGLQDLADEEGTRKRFRNEAIEKAFKLSRRIFRDQASTGIESPSEFDNNDSTQSITAEEAISGSPSRRAPLPVLDQESRLRSNHSFDVRPSAGRSNIYISRDRQNAPMYEAKFDVGDLVWRKDSTGRFVWLMSVTERRHRQGWEFRLLEASGVLYGDGDGSWVAENDLRGV